MTQAARIGPGGGGGSDSIAPFCLRGPSNTCEGRRAERNWAGGQTVPLVRNDGAAALDGLVSVERRDARCHERKWHGLAPRLRQQETSKALERDNKRGNWHLTSIWSETSGAEVSRESRHGQSGSPQGHRVGVGVASARMGQALQGDQGDKATAGSHVLSLHGSRSPWAERWGRWR